MPSFNLSSPGAAVGTTLPLMSKYATNHEFIAFFEKHGIAVAGPRVDKPSHTRRFTVVASGSPMSLPMDAPPAECLRLVREHLAAHPPTGAA